MYTLALITATPLIKYVVIAGLVMAILILCVAILLFRSSGQPRGNSCPRCHTPLPPGVTGCPRCDAAATEPAQEQEQPV